MKFLRSALTAVAILSAIVSFSQPICGFDVIHQKKMNDDPAYRKNILETEANIRSYIVKHKTQLEARVTGVNATLYNIPVVVHVIHTGGAIGSIYNPTDAQILGAINYLNNVYNGTDPSLSGGVGDLQIQFVLAQRDPNCNPTNGINRVDGSSLPNYAAAGVNNSTSGGTPNGTLKSYIQWPTSDYYNIWIVDKIDGNDGTSGQFIAGYAQLAGGPSATDGTVMLATQMIAGQKTLPHEIGHAFSLYHPFQGSPDKNTCAAVTGGGCSVDGDQICDTDPITYNQLGGVIDFTCRTGTNVCASAAYSINTESNYMNYTTCYTLFTAGQKARLLASAASGARSSLSTSMGGTPTYSATACTPKIDFEFTEDQMTEATVTTTGCRSYKDYTYNMVIGSNPSAAATATLSMSSGTATEGVDFDITTNGSFSSPSKIITFPAGSHTSQPFTVRIYDDAIVESTETITLGFTVNNGGGTAVKGDGRINLTLTVIDNDVPPAGPSSITITPAGTNIGNIQSPLAGASVKQRSQMIYLASELISAGLKAGNITGITMNIVKNSSPSFVYTGFSIRMALTTHKTVYTPSVEVPLSFGSFTSVYSSNYTTVNGVNTFTFSTPFTWDGTSNIMVDMCYDNGATTGATDNCVGYRDTSSNTSSTNYLFGAINCSTNFGSVSFYSYGIKPAMQFIYADPGAQVETTQNTSRQEYLGPNADVYFYDQLNGNLMARITNTTSFNYGCTTVLVDRNITSAGSNSVAFWSNTPANYLFSKTLKVNPTTNNVSGSYQMSLYYTQAEVNAWQTATGQSISSAQVIKVTSQISDVTPASPNGGGTVTIATPTITSIGTNTALTASFSNGFSGFGAGVAGVALPVTLIDFKGTLQKNNTVLLEWNTASEINSRYFDVERSSDGITFSKIGSVNAAENSSVAHYYSFTDPVALEHNYYRLKEVDIDSKYEYSKIILVNKNDAGNFRVINNPFINVINIDFGKTQTGKADIRLLDVTGKEIYHVVNDASGQSRLQVNVSGKNISAGIYLLQVNTNHGQFIARIMKQ